MLLITKITKSELNNYRQEFLKCLNHNYSNSYFNQFIIYTDDIDHKINIPNVRVIYKKKLPEDIEIIKQSKISSRFNKIILSDPFILFQEDLYKITDEDLLSKIFINQYYKIYSKNVKYPINEIFDLEQRHINLSTKRINNSVKITDLNQKSENILIKKSIYNPQNINPTSRHKKIDAIIVSVNYNDYLLLTLVENKKIFENITVVTSEDDKLCQEICEKLDVNCVISHRLYEEGAIFNKGKAINDGIKSIEDPDLILLLDADIIVADKINTHLLSDDCLYTSSRKIYKDYNSFTDKKNFIDEVDKGFGFFQLFCFNNPVINKKMPFPENSNSAEGSDLAFRDKFPNKKSIGKEVIHLGDTRKNWKGRTTKKFIDDETFNRILKKNTFDINTYFDKIYCLNLDRRPDRWEKVSKEFEKFNIKVERFSAIDGNSLEFKEPIEDIQKLSDKGLIENKYALACLRSHKKIIEDAKLNDYGKILIFEDDIIFSEDFSKKIRKIRNLDWRLIYLGASQFIWSKIEFQKYFYFSKKTLGTFAYGVNKSLYDEITEILDFEIKSVDNSLTLIQEKNYGKCFTFHPNIVVPENKDSDIRKISKSYKDFESKKISRKKIALLFLTVNDLIDKNSWVDYFKNDNFNIYFHSKNTTDHNSKYQIKNKIETKWGDISLVEATNNLIETALSDDDNSFFILLSESCTPLKSPEFTYNKIIEMNKSWIFYYNWNHKHNIDRINKLLLKVNEFYKQSQFMILSRKHAEFINKNNHTFLFKNINVPDEHYYINILKNFYKNFDEENICFPATYVFRGEGKTGMSTNPIKILDLNHQYSDCRNDFGECQIIKDELNTSLFFRKIGVDTKIINRKLKINRDKAISNLIEITEILKKNNVKHWITDGTLLGLYREGDFIPHDTDTDIGVLHRTFNRDVLEQLKECDFSVKYVWGLYKDSLEISIVKNNIKTDIFFFYEKNEENEIYHSAFNQITEESCHRVDYIYKPFNLIKRTFLNHEFFTPEDATNYLETKYGKDWTYSKKDWKYDYSPLNHKKTGLVLKRIDILEDFNKFEIGFYDDFYTLQSLTLLIKSFLRKDCVIELIKSIRKKYKFVKIIVIDDSDKNYNFDFDDNIKTFNIEFDSGLSYSRNYGVSKIETDYFILLDDDFIFTENTDLKKWVEIFKESNLDILGGQVIENGKINKYYGNFEYDKLSKTLIVNSDDGQFDKNYKKCELILNFFIAKTESVKKHGWDNELKLAEHTAFFFENKDKLNIGYTNLISIEHKKFRSPDYLKFRERGQFYFNNWLNKKNISKYINIYGQITNKR